MVGRLRWYGLACPVRSLGYALRSLRQHLLW